MQFTLYNLEVVIKYYFASQNRQKNFSFFLIGDDIMVKDINTN